MNTDILATDGTYSYIFDANGNLISRTDVSDPEQDSYWSYSYDVDNRLTKVERIVNGSTSKTINYWYDPMGNLVKKTCTISGQSTTTDYTVDIAQGLTVVLIEDSSSEGTLLFTYGEDLLKVSKDGDYYYFYDGLGSTRTITSGAAGTAVAEYLYDAYGSQLLTGQPTWNTRLFTAETCDPDTGLIYLRARWYDPGTGRFVSRDSYGENPQDPLSLHRYIYCGDDPFNRVDPSGHEFSLGGVMSAVSTAVTLASHIWTCYDAYQFFSRILLRQGPSAWLLSSFLARRLLAVSSKWQQ